ncbi:MAG TPA: VOC family protein [Rubrivivax sp.]|nr:VOC family protein [Rubrivivax sp.]
MSIDRRHFLVAAFASASAAAQGLAPGPLGQPGQRHPGRFVWFDLATDDPDSARAFYGSVFGWRFRRVPDANAGYTLIENDDGRVGGVLRQARPPQAPVGSRWLSLISVPDAQRSARLVPQLGGQELVAPAEVPGRGTHALFRDPQGAVFGVLAASGGDPPDGPVSEGEVFWLDLLTPDPAQAAAFYAALIGYDLSENEAGVLPRRRILSSQGIARAGVAALPAGVSGPGWLPYILVDGLAAALRRALAAGGRVVLPPRPQWLHGQLAVIADPHGGVTGLVDWWAAQAKEAGS